MTTLKEVKELFENEYVDLEVYEGSRLHTDYCREAENYSDDNEVEEWELVDEDGYNRTILANGSLRADFDDWYGDTNAKVLLVLLKK